MPPTLQPLHPPLSAWLTGSVLLLIIGAGSIQQPLMMAALIGGTGFFILCLARPAWALAAFLFAHVAFPVYIKLPAIGPIPPSPPSLAMLASLGTASMLSSMLSGSQDLALEKRERSFITLLLLFAVAALLSLLNGRTTGDSVNMGIKAFLFPLLVLWIVVRT